MELNRRGAAPLEALPPLAPLSIAQVHARQSEGALVLDTRPAMDFAAAHIPGSVHIALAGQYASWAARLLGLDTRLILLAGDPDALHESQLRLARVGMENVCGAVENGIAGWSAAGGELDYIPQISARELAELRQKEPDRITVLDVRERSERESGAIPDSTGIPLGELSARIAELDPTRLLVVHCKGGYRSSIAASILRRHSFRDIANLTGGFDAWSAMLQSAGA